MKKHLIAFLDSGVGGITVLSCAERYLRGADFIYYADTDNVPYGTKTHAKIVSYVDNAVRCLISRGVDAIVIACNTATSIAVEIMRERYALPIIGMEPALKPAVKHHPDGRVLVCATPVTVAADKLHTLIELTGSHPDLCAAPELVTFAESGVFDTDTVSAYLNELVPGSESYDAVVLGCTHFTYFRDSFERVFPNAEIIDGNYGTVKRLASVLGLELSHDIPEDGADAVYLRSGREVTDPDDLRSLRAYEKRMTEYYNSLT